MTGSSGTGKVYELHGLRVFECIVDGTTLERERDAADVLSAAWRENCNFLLIPREKLNDEFFDLKTGVAGSFLQKFVTYGMRCAIVGDIGELLEKSRALRDLVKECNRGGQVWVVKDRAELADRLAHA